MAPELGLCVLCSVQKAQYKCSTCAIPFCSLVCYKPHKEGHKIEEDLKSATAATEDEVPADTAPTSSATEEITSMYASIEETKSSPPPQQPEAEPTPRSELNFTLLLSNEPLMHALTHNKALRASLKSIHGAGLKSTFDAQNARLLQSSHSSYRGRGRGGRNHFEKRPVEWTVERGTDRQLKRIKALRKGGREEDTEVEEFCGVVCGGLGLYEEGKAW